MKTIKLNESQLSIFKRIVETESAPDFEDGDIKEYGDSSENGTTAVIHNDDGNPIYGEMPTGDEISHSQCPQSWWANGTLAGSRNVRP